MNKANFKGSYEAVLQKASQNLNVLVIIRNQAQHKKASRVAQHIQTVKFSQSPRQTVQELKCMLLKQFNEGLCDSLNSSPAPS